MVLNFFYIFTAAGISALRSGGSPRKKKTSESCKATQNGTTKKIGRTAGRGKGGWSTLRRTQRGIYVHTRVALHVNHFF